MNHSAGQGKGTIVMTIYAHESAATSPVTFAPHDNQVPLVGPSPTVENVKADGLVSLGRLHGDSSWEDWRMVGAALLVITQEAQAEVGASKWSPDNKQLVKAFNVHWETYERSAGGNRPPLSKQERSALREVFATPEIEAWRNTLTAEERRRLNHPKTVAARFKSRMKKASPEQGNKPSPMAKLKEANVALQEELHAVKQNGGDLFTSKTSPKIIAKVVIAQFDGVSNRLDKVEAIGRELLAWVKREKTSAT
jgi:hypothetical protein